MSWLVRPRRAVLVVALAVATAAAPAAAEPDLPAGLPAAARARLQPVTDRASLSTRVDGEPFVARREIFEYLLDHPEFATHVTRTLRLARYRIWKTADGLGIDDGWGTVGSFELVWAGPGTRVMYARGVFHHKVLPEIHGQAVVAIDYATQPTSGGKDLIQTAVTGFVRLDSRLLNMAGKLASSVATTKAEKEAKKLVKVFMRTTRAVEDNPAAVYQQLRQRPDVPAPELEGFRRLLNVPPVHADAPVAATPPPPPPRAR